MKLLSISDYDAAEAQALVDMPNYVVLAFQALIFQTYGYPTKVRIPTELKKYVDTMHERRFDNDYVQLMGGGLTPQEMQDVVQLNRHIAEFTSKELNDRKVAKNATLRSLHVLRQIQCLIGTDQKARIFEVGPGCGYLTALLLMNGHSVAATDITQAFYLYQNHLWNYVTGGGVAEYVSRRSARGFENDLSPGRAVHLPWWHFAMLRGDTLPEFDFVTCNHALCEMNPDALRFVVRAAREMLRGGDHPKAFVFESWGWDIENSQSSVCQVFVENGFSLVHNDHELTVFVPSASPYATGAMNFPTVERRQELRVDNGQLSAIEVTSQSYAPPMFHSPTNPFSAGVLRGRSANAAARTVTREQLLNAYREILGGEVPLTADEEFWDFIGKPLG